MQERTATLYLRVSTVEQVEHGVSLAAQERRLRAYCEAQALEVTQVIRDEGVSASKPLASRPGGSELLKTVRAKKARHVVALKLDRLFRNAQDALAVTSEWDRKSVALHLVDMGGTSLNSGTAMGRMMLTMTAAFAELERNLIGERTSAALQHKRDQGEVYGPVPMGFDCDGGRLIENADERAIVEYMQSLRKDGASLRAVAKALNDKGIPTKNRGRQWYASSVRVVLDRASTVAQSNRNGHSKTNFV